MENNIATWRWASDAVRCLVVGNPENRRLALFQQALARRGLPEADVVAYVDLLTSELPLDSLATVTPAEFVRIESPGENAIVEAALVALGARSAACPEEPPIRPPAHGEIYHPRLWYAGYCRLLERLQTQSNCAGRWFNHPAEIARMFDKLRCQQELAAHGLPVPSLLGTVRSYDELRHLLGRAGQVFVKLRHGSSASGVVALRVAGMRVSATTTVEIVDEGQRGLRLYNSLKLRRYEHEGEVARLIDALAPHEAYAEQWLPKAGFSGDAFDLRVLVIAGRLRHVVMRASRGPITNLHLGNRRGNLDQLRLAIPSEAWEAAGETCRRAAALFSRSLYVGIDLMFEPGFRRHAILEVNAFGDLLPGVLDDGEDTYTAEVTAMHRRASHAYTP